MKRICIQALYWGAFTGKILPRGEGSMIGQREKLNCDAKGALGFRMALQHCYT